jgi:hypothetical protein
MHQVSAVVVQAMGQEPMLLSPTNGHVLVDGHGEVVVHL